MYRHAIRIDTDSLSCPKQVLWNVAHYVYTVTNAIARQFLHANVSKILERRAAKEL